jgi:hypothetical protein
MEAAAEIQARAGSSDITRYDRVFYTGMACVLLAIVFAGFAPTYFLKGYFGAPPLTPLVHLHGALYTAWTVLFLMQAVLVAGHRTDIHRRTGAVGALLALAMLPVGVLTAVRAAANGLAPPGLDPLVFLVVPLGAVVVFAVLIGAALLARSTPETHKRLMLLATISLMTPAIARLGFVGPKPLLALGLTNALIVVPIAYDLVVRRRLHRAYLWGGLFIVLSEARLLLGRTDAWRAFAQWLTQ